MIFELMTFKPEPLKYPITICAYNIYKNLLERYPKRELHADYHCPQDHFYYFNRQGQMRMVDSSDWSIWICDHDKGFPYMKRLR